MTLCTLCRGSHEAIARCQLHPGLFARLCCHRRPLTAAGCQPTPEKVHGTVQQQFFRDCGKSQHTSGTRPHFPHELDPAPANVVAFWGLLGPGGLTASTKCPSSSGTASPMLPENLLDHTLLLGIRPSHQNTTWYGAVELQTLRSPCLQS